MLRLFKALEELLITLIEDIRTRGSISLCPKVEFATLLETLLDRILDNLNSREGRD